MSPSADVQKATLQKFINAWSDSWNLAGLDEVFDDNLIQTTLPLSLGVPDRGKADTMQIIPLVKEYVKGYKLTINHILHDAENNKAVIQARGEGATKDGPFKMEYAAFVTFTATGEKIAVIEEMVDSAALHDFSPKLQKFLTERAGAE